MVLLALALDGKQARLVLVADLLSVRLLADPADPVSSAVAVAAAVLR